EIGPAVQQPQRAAGPEKPQLPGRQPQTCCADRQRTVVPFFDNEQQFATPLPLKRNLERRRRRSLDGMLPRRPLQQLEPVCFVPAIRFALNSELKRPQEDLL